MDPRLEALREFYFREKRALVLREPHGRFAHPYLTPGGGYTRAIWDWDAYFLGLGLVAVEGELRRYLEGTARLFIDMREPDGFVPSVQAVDREEHPLTAFRRQGLPINPIKPVLAQMLALAAGSEGAPFADRERFEGVREIIGHWDTYQRHRTGLYVLRSHRASGPDNDPCVYGRPENSSAPVITNVLMLREFEAMARLAGDLGLAEADDWRGRAADLRERINALMWDGEDAWYYSQDVGYRTPHIGFPSKQSTEGWAMPLRVRTGTAVMALWAGVPDAEQARAMVGRYFADASDMRARYGVRSLSRRSRFYNTVNTHGPIGRPGAEPGAFRFIGAGVDSSAAGPANWQGPVWLVLNYCLFGGLLRYGYRAEAERVFEDSVELLHRDLRTNGTTHEYFHPETGEGMGAGDFMNWNLNVFTMWRRLCGDPDPEDWSR